LRRLDQGVVALRAAVDEALLVAGDLLVVEKGEVGLDAAGLVAGHPFGAGEGVAERGCTSP